LPAHLGRREERRFAGFSAVAVASSTEATFLPGVAIG
jgi:hypothetical protein